MVIYRESVLTLFGLLNFLKFLFTTEVEKRFVGQINYLLSILYSSIIIYINWMIRYPSRHVFYSFLHTLKNNRSRNSMKLISTTEIEKTYVGQINYLLSILYSSIIIYLKSIILYLVGHFLKSFLHTLRTIWHILLMLDHKIPCSQILKKHFVFFTSDVVHER